jgi:hypothetical protein
MLVAHAGIGWFTSQTFTRTGLDRLPAHLEQEYGITLSGVTELDVGVYRIARADGLDWVARVFPAARPRSAAEGDAAVLKALAAGGFPAERCAVEAPVSVLDGQSVLSPSSCRASGRGVVAGRTPSWVRCWAACTPAAGTACRQAVPGTTWRRQAHQPTRSRWPGPC